MSLLKSVWVVMAVLSLAAASQSASAATIIYENSFENDNNGSKPAGWNNRYGWGSYHVTTSQSSHGNKSVYVAGTGGNCNWLYKNNIGADGDTTLTFDMMLPSRGSHGTDALVNLQGFSSYFKGVNQSQYVLDRGDLGHFNYGTWYSFQIDIDWDAATAVYSSGGVATDPISFTPNTSKGIQLYAQHGNGKAYFDNLVLYDGLLSDTPTTPAPLALPMALACLLIARSRGK